MSTVEYSKPILKVNLLSSWCKDKAKVTFINLEEEISKCFTLSLEIITEEKNKDFDKSCNKEICLGLYKTSKDKVEGDPDRYISGTIDHVTKSIDFYKPAQNSKVYNTYMLCIRPKFYFLNQSVHNRNFFKEEQKLADIIEKVLKEHKVKYQLDLENKDKLVSINCLQYQETDLNFLTRLMTKANLCYFFKHEKDKETLIITDKTSSYLKISNKIAHINDTYRGVDVVEKISFRKYNINNKFKSTFYSIEKPEKNASEENTEKLDHIETPLESEQQYFISDAEVKDSSNAKQNAKNVTMYNQHSYETLMASAKNMPCTSLVSGGIFSLEGKQFNDIKEKSYLISELKFNASFGEVNNKFSSGFSIKAIPTKSIKSPDNNVQNTPKNQLGVIVTKDKKEDGKDPVCEKGRYVYVKLSSLEEENNLLKAFLLSHHGVFSIPRPGTYVNVSFVDNSLYNNMPFVSEIHNIGMAELFDWEKEEDRFNTIYSVYHKEGQKEQYNSIRFQDEKEKQEIKIEARKDILSNIKNRSITLIGKTEEKGKEEEKYFLFIEKGNKKMTLAEGDEEKELKKGNKTLTLVEGKDTINLKKGDQIIELTEGSQKITLKKGDQVITISDGNNKLVCEKGKISIEAKDDIQITTKNNFILDAGGNIELKCKGKFSLEAPQGIDAKASQGNFTSKAMSTKLESQMSYETKALSTKIESQTSFDTKALVTNLKSDAMSTIKAAMVKIG